MRPIGNGGRPTNQTTEHPGSTKPGTGKDTTLGFKEHPDEYNAVSRALVRNERTRRNIRGK